MRKGALSGNLPMFFLVVISVGLGFQAYTASNTFATEVSQGVSDIGHISETQASNDMFFFNHIKEAASFSVHQAAYDIGQNAGGLEWSGETIESIEMNDLHSKLDVDSNTYFENNYLGSFQTNQCNIAKEELNLILGGSSSMLMETNNIDGITTNAENKYNIDCSFDGSTVSYQADEGGLLINFNATGNRYFQLVDSTIKFYKALDRESDEFKSEYDGDASLCDESMSEAREAAEQEAASEFEDDYENAIQISREEAMAARGEGYESDFGMKTSYTNQLQEGTDIDGWDGEVIEVSTSTGSCNCPDDDGGDRDGDDDTFDNPYDGGDSDSDDEFDGAPPGLEGPDISDGSDSSDGSDQPGARQGDDANEGSEDGDPLTGLFAETTSSLITGDFLKRTQAGGCDTEYNADVSIRPLDIKAESSIEDSKFRVPTDTVTEGTNWQNLEFAVEDFSKEIDAAGQPVDPSKIECNSGADQDEVWSHTNNIIDDPEFDFPMERPYYDTYDNEWIFDFSIEMHEDVNGDGVFNIDDVYFMNAVEDRCAFDEVPDKVSFDYSGSRALESQEEYWSASEDLFDRLVQRREKSRDEWDMGVWYLNSDAVQRPGERNSCTLAGYPKPEDRPDDITPGNVEEDNPHWDWTEGDDYDSALDSDDGWICVWPYPAELKSEEYKNPGEDLPWREETTQTRDVEVADTLNFNGQRSGEFETSTPSEVAAASALGLSDNEFQNLVSSFATRKPVAEDSAKGLEGMFNMITGNALVRVQSTSPKLCDSCPGANDPDGDGLYEDVDGNGVFEENDEVYLYWGISTVTDSNVQYFDFDGNGRITIGDAEELSAEYTGEGQNGIAQDSPDDPDSCREGSSCDLPDGLPESQVYDGPAPLPGNAQGPDPGDQQQQDNPNIHSSPGINVYRDQDQQVSEVGFNSPMEAGTMKFECPLDSFEMTEELEEGDAGPRIYLNGNPVPLSYLQENDLTVEECESLEDGTFQLFADTGGQQTPEDLRAEGTPFWIDLGETLANDDMSLNFFAAERGFTDQLYFRSRSEEVSACMRDSGGLRPLSQLSDEYGIQKCDFSSIIEFSSGNYRLSVCRYDRDAERAKAVLHGTTSVSEIRSSCRQPTGTMTAPEEGVMMPEQGIDPGSEESEGSESNQPARSGTEVFVAGNRQMCTYNVPETVTPDQTVSPSSGNDAQNIQDAVNQADPGDTIYLEGGTYEIDEPIEIQNSGSSGNRIVLAGKPGERPSLDFSGIPVPDSGDDPNWFGAFVIRGDYLTVRNMEMKNSPGFGIRIRSSDNNIVENVNSHDHYLSALQIRKGFDNTVRHSKFHHTYNSKREGQDADGIGIKGTPRGSRGLNDPDSYSTTGNRVECVDMYYNSDDGIDLYRTANNEVFFSRAWKNGFYEEGEQGAQSNGNGFKLGGGDQSGPGYDNPDPHLMTGGHLIVGNIAWANKGRNNDRARPGTGFDTNGARLPILMYHNTAVDDEISYSVQASAYGGDHTLINNLASGATGDYKYGSYNENHLTDLHLEHGAQSSNSWNKGIESVEFESKDPTEDGFLIPVDNSPVVDAGETIGDIDWDTSGSSPDIGASEKGR